MLAALELENFKAFGAPTRIELAPITLIYGQNSAGKSSILNALNLLKQTRMSREQGALLLPRAERGLVDLGSFHELLHDHDLSRTLKIRLDAHATRSVMRRTSKEDKTLDLGFEIGFRRPDNQHDVALAFLQAYAGSGQPIVRFEPSDLSERDVRSLSMYPGMAYWRGAQRTSARKLKGATCVSVSKEPSFWAHAYGVSKAAQEVIVRALNGLRRDVRSDEHSQGDLFGRAAPNEPDIDSAVSFYSSDYSLEDFAARRANAGKGALIALDGFMPLPTRLLGSPAYPEVLAARYSSDNRVRRSMAFGATELMVEAGRALESSLDRLFPLGPFRRAPKRLYIFTGTTPVDVGYSGDLLPDLLYRKRQVLQETNAWLARLDMGYRLKIEPVGTPSNDLFEVRLLDTRRASKASIALPDVGFGISQILPFIVQSLASRDQTLTIEQPEVHIHPKLQADLGDLLIAGIQEPRNHQFIIETHSEHLVLRLLRRIRETTDGLIGEGEQGLRPDQLSVIYVERGADGPKVHRLRVDDQGEFVDRWPQGFFEERAAELF